MSVRRIASKLEVFKNAFHRRIKNSIKITFKKILKKPYLKEHHKTIRLNWEKKMMFCGDKYLSTIISDEKKWHLGWDNKGYKIGSFKFYPDGYTI